MSEATLGRANVIIGAALDQLDKDLDDAKGRVTSALEGIAKIASGIMIGGFAALAGGLAASVSEAMGAQEAVSQLDVALNALGDRAAVGRDALLGYAGAMQGVTRFSDETVMAAEGVLLRFTSIGEDVFPQALDAASDLATGMGVDLSRAAEMLGRAMEDPDLAARSLRSANILLTEAEEKQLKAMKEAGDAAGIQALILGKVQQAYGGAAEAAGQTFAGQLDRLKNRFSDLLEQVGGAVLPVLQLLADRLLTALASPQVQAAIAAVSEFVSGLAYALEDVFSVLFTGENDMDAFVEFFSSIIGQGAAQQVADIVVSIAGFLRDQLLPAIIGFISQKAVIIGVLAIVAAGFLVWGINAGIAAAATIAALAPVIAVVAAIGLVAGLLYAAWEGNWLGIRDALQAAWAVIYPALQQIWAWLSENLPKAIQFISDRWNATWPVIAAVAKEVFDRVIGGARQIWSILVPVFETIGKIIAEVWTGTIQPALVAFYNQISTWWTEISPRVMEAWSAIWGFLQPIFEWIWNAAVTVFTAIRDFIVENQETIRTIFESIWNVIAGVLNWFWSLISGVFSMIVDAIRGDWTQVWVDFQNMLSGLWNALVQIWTAIWDIIKAVALLIWAAIGDYIMAAVNWIVSTAVNNFNAFVAFWVGLWNTVKGFFVGIWNSIVSWIQGVIQSVVDYVVGQWTGFVTNITTLWNNLVNLATTVWNMQVDAIRNIILAIKTWLEDRWNEIITFVTGIWDTIVERATTAWGLLQTAIQTVVETVKGWIEEKFNAIVSFFTGLPGQFQKIGKDIFQGLWDGLKGIWDSIMKWVEEQVGWLIDTFGSILGISSPSRVFAEFGAQIGAGLIQGMRESMRGLADTAQQMVVSMEPGEREAGGESNQWTVNIYPQQATGSILNDLLVAQNIIGV